MSELTFHHWLTWGLITAGPVVFVALFFITAPYGRHARAGWGPNISTRVGWILMESPAFLAFLGFYATGKHALEPAPLALCALFLVHYGHRSFIYPFRLKNAKKP